MTHYMVALRDPRNFPTKGLEVAAIAGATAWAVNKVGATRHPLSGKKITTEKSGVLSKDRFLKFNALGACNFCKASLFTDCSAQQLKGRSVHCTVCGEKADVTQLGDHSGDLDINGTEGTPAAGAAEVSDDAEGKIPDGADEDGSPPAAGAESVEQEVARLLKMVDRAGAMDDDLPPADGADEGVEDDAAGDGDAEVARLEKALAKAKRERSGLSYGNEGDGEGDAPPVDADAEGDDAPEADAPAEDEVARLTKRLERAKLRTRKVRRERADADPEVDLSGNPNQEQPIEASDGLDDDAPPADDMGDDTPAEMADDDAPMGDDAPMDEGLGEDESPAVDAPPEADEADPMEQPEDVPHAPAEGDDLGSGDDESIPPVDAAVGEGEGLEESEPVDGDEMPAATMKDGELCYKLSIHQPKLDGGEVAMTLIPGRDEYAVFVDGLPEGRIERANVEQGLQSIFGSEVFETAFRSAAIGNPKLAHDKYGLRPFPIELSVDKSMQAILDRRLVKERAARVKADSNRKVTESAALGTALLGTFKGTLGGKSALRDAIVSELAAHGFENAGGIVDRALANAVKPAALAVREEFAKLLSKGQEARDEIARMVDTAGVLSSASTGVVIPMIARPTPEKSGVPLAGGAMFAHLTRRHNT